MSVRDIFEKRKQVFTADAIYSLGIQLINILEKIHAAGLVYNDLNLDNILLDYGFEIEKDSKDIFENFEVNLIDMSFSTLYIDKKSLQHVGKKTIDAYRGSVFFSSLNQLKFQTTSRRDDMLSLFYLMIYLFNDCVVQSLKRYIIK